MAFSNEAALKAALVSACTRAVDDVEKRVFEEFSGNLGKFYAEFTPKEYIRTQALFGSLDRTGVMPTGNGATARVYFNTPSYQQGMMLLQHTPEHGMYGWATWSGGQVLESAMHGSHGGYAGGTAIWDESMGKLGDIKGLLVQALRAQGIPIK